MLSLEAHGYKVFGIIVRTHKYKKQTKGKSRRSKYEGKGIYVRVRLVDGRRRDLYLGTPAAAAARWSKPGVENGALDELAGELEIESGEREWRNMPQTSPARSPRGRRRR